MLKHINNHKPCPLCAEKLLQAHQDLSGWFNDHVKPNYPQCHVSWSYRGKQDQEKAFLDGKSKLHYPLSAHNKHDDSGEPCSLALDLFELDFNGIARWSWKFFRDIANDAKQLPIPIKWGGDFKTISDADHFELNLTIDA